MYFFYLWGGGKELFYIFSNFSETMKYQRERETPRTPDLKTTAKPETSKLKDLALKGTERGKRNCETTRTKTAKVKQMYEVERGTSAK